MNEITSDIMDIIVSSFLIILGWGITHYLALRKSARDKKREVTTEYLINAWRTLESASNRSDNSHNAKLETAIADIQLLGTKKQIELAQQMAVQISQTGVGDTLELLIQLREDLRKELGIDPVGRDLKILRFQSDHRSIKRNRTDA